VRRDGTGPHAPGEPVIRYGDWRLVDGAWLPFRIDVDDPDLPFAIDVATWRLGDPGTGGDLCAPPAGARLRGSPAVDLCAVPPAPIAEPDDPLGGAWVRHWGIPTPPEERWLVHLVVTEARGRPVEPVGARIEYHAGPALVKTEELGPDAVRALRRFPVARFHAPPEQFHLRRWCAEPMALGVDRMVWTLRLSAGHEELAPRLEVPVRRVTPRTPLRFPLAGRCLVLVGHEPHERSHVYERSQRFAIDVVPLDARDCPLVGPAAPAAGHPGLVVRAPAPGVVIHARDDVPDGLPAAAGLGLDDPLTAIGGNGVVLDHGTGEFSVLFHLRHGSLRVTPGEAVRAGQALGLVGSSGTPGFPHLHYHLQDGPRFLAADGLPLRFDGVTLARSLLPPLSGGAAAPAPRRGYFIDASGPEDCP
jgi:hypothetical protein